MKHILTIEIESDLDFAIDGSKVKDKSYYDNFKNLRIKQEIESYLDVNVKILKSELKGE